MASPQSKHQEPVLTPAGRAESAPHLQVVRPEGVEEGDAVRVGDGDDRTVGRTTAPRSGPVRRRVYSVDPDALLEDIVDTGVVAIDLETRGLHPHARTDSAVGAIICRSNGNSYILREFPLWWKNVLEDAETKKILHNAKFDLMWMIDAFNWQLPKVRNVQDTMLKSQLMHEYRTFGGPKKAGLPPKLRFQPNDLGSVQEELLGHRSKLDINHDEVDWCGSWTEEMEEYMLADIEDLEDIDAEEDRILAEQGQTRAAQIECDAVFAHSWMTINGIKPDKEQWWKSVIEWRNEQRHMLKHLSKYFPEVQNFNSPQQVLKAVRRLTGAPIADTKHTTLSTLAPYYPPIDALLTHRLYAHRMKNWGNKLDPEGNIYDDFLTTHICLRCGRFHPDWRQIGTETSRMSCSRPNLQQIPRVSEFRRLFVAEEGMLLCSLDYSSIEVLTAAVFAHCKALIEACATGDPHAALAEKIVGRPIDKKIPADAIIRQHAKIADFGLLFAGGKDGLQRQAREIFDVELSDEQTEKIFNLFFDAYPELLNTKRWAYQMTAWNDEKTVDIVNKVGFRRHLEGFDKKPTTALNTWIQSTAGYGLKASYPYIMEEDLLPYLCMQVHDELVSEFFEDEAEELAAIQKQCMIRGMRSVLGNVPVTVDDSAIGKVWL
jgi:DNA polymerase I